MSIARSGSEREPSRPTEVDPSFPRKRESRRAEVPTVALDPRFRGGDAKDRGVRGEGQWPVVSLAEVATLSSGGTPSKSRAEFWAGDIPWISPKDMKSGHIKDAEDRITPEAIAAVLQRL